MYVGDGPDSPEFTAWLLSMLDRSYRTLFQVNELCALTIAAVHPLLACPRTTRTAVYPVWVAPRAADKFLWHSHRNAPRDGHIPPVPPFLHRVPLVAGLPCGPPPFGFQLPLLPIKLLLHAQTLGTRPRTRVALISVSNIKFCCIGGTRGTGKRSAPIWLVALIYLCARWHHHPTAKAHKPNCSLHPAPPVHPSLYILQAHPSAKGLTQ